MTEKLKTVLAVIGLSAIVIVSADLLGRIAASVDERFFDPPGNRSLVDDDLRASLPAYDGVDYDPLTVLEEVRKSDRAVYQPYIVWKRRPYRGEYTTIGVDGLRRTVNNSSEPDALQVWMFGGSTVWGVGAPDDETIPSHLARLLNDAVGVETVVRNLGERGFVSTQEVIYLMRELQAGRRPDAVLFYDGVNDAAAVSLWPEFPGAHVSYDTVRDRFEARNDNGGISSFARSTGLYRASRIILDRLEDKPFEGDGIVVYTSDDDGAEPDFGWLAERGIDLWLDNVRVVESLSRAYGFTPLMIFQPGLWSEGKPLDPSEVELLTTEMEFASIGTIMSVRAQMASTLDERLADSQPRDAIINLNELFDGTPDPVYIDYVHVTGRGNELAAERVAEALVKRLCANPPDRVAGPILEQLRSTCKE
jgi:lysophospholipase L1-like esterase